MQPEPIPLDARHEPCPECGATLPDDAVLCTTCGYDLAAVKRRETVVGRPVEVPAAPAAPKAAAAPEPIPSASGSVASAEAIAAAADEPAIPLAPLVRDGNLRLTLAVAGVLLLVLLILHLAGLRGLFPRVDGLFLDAQGSYTESSPRWIDRWATIGRLLIESGVLWVAAFVGLLLLASLRGVPFGDLRLGAARLAAITLATLPWFLLAFQNRSIEGITEAFARAATFVLLAWVWLRLTPMEAVQLLAATVIGAAVIDLASLVVAWSLV